MSLLNGIKYHPFFRYAIFDNRGFVWHMSLAGFGTVVAIAINAVFGLWPVDQGWHITRWIMGLALLYEVGQFIFRKVIKKDLEAVYAPGVGDFKTQPIERWLFDTVGDMAGAFAAVMITLLIMELIL